MPQKMKCCSFIGCMFIMKHSGTVVITINDDYTTIFITSLNYYTQNEMLNPQGLYSIVDYVVVHSQPFTTTVKKFCTIPFHKQKKLACLFSVDVHIFARFLDTYRKH